MSRKIKKQAEAVNQDRFQQQPAPSSTTAYHVEYRRKNLKEFRVYVPKGSNLEAWINSQDSASAYLRELAEADMNANDS